MEMCPLAKVRHRIKLGSPLPFSIRDPGNRLLVARDQVVADEHEFAALVDRGACVNLDEMRGLRAEVYDAAPEALPALWHKLGDQLARVLRGMPSPQAPQALDEAARYLAALAERAPDLALFVVLRRDPIEPLQYGVMRCLQAATAAHLVALRLEWPSTRCLTLVKAAFTMNLGMLELQERLSNQARLPNPAQRQAIAAHPVTSAATLRDSGVADEEWLQAVAQHHERPGGNGYPAGVDTVGELANALRTVDLYTAKLAGRSGRDPQPPDRAARDLLVAERGNPFALALVTEFGLWPPGSLVRLHSGEVAVVVRRGTDAGAPMVAVLSDARGQALHAPIQREACGREHGIAGGAHDRTSRLRVNAERLYASAGV